MSCGIYPSGPVVGPSRYYEMDRGSSARSGERVAGLYLGQHALGKIESVLNVIEFGGAACVFNVAPQSVYLAAQQLDLFVKVAHGACGVDCCGTADPFDGRGGHKYEYRKADCKAGQEHECVECCQGRLTSRACQAALATTGGAAKRFRGSCQSRSDVAGPASTG